MTLLAQGSNSRKRERALRPGEGAEGPFKVPLAGRIAARSRQAQTAAGSSSTRRLRVRFGSSWMPGPMVVVRAAFFR
ncbi:hypothetical protein GCM10010286_09120 [Streptomyces toxytricini]|nr:hypothetical protein GCM10010286_09120 [Streptomyces toxytricini]